MTGKAKGMKRSGFQRSPGQEEFWAKVTEDGTKPCFFERGNAGACDYWPTFVADAHHALKKRWVTDAFAKRAWMRPDQKTERQVEYEAALKDGRNGIPCCRRHHDALEAHSLYIARSELPGSVFAFAKDYGLESLLDRAFPERETDAA